MGQRIIDSNGEISFIDENGVQCFIDQDGNFTCEVGAQNTSSKISSILWKKRHSIITRT